MDHELLARLARTPGTLAHLVAECPEERFQGEAPGEWSPQTILAHLRDDEYLCMRVALERMLAEEAPALRFLDGGDWAPRRNRTRDRKDHLLADFALQRQATIAILRLLRPEDWQRTGTRDGAALTIEDLVREWVAHDADHVAQLERAVGETLGEVLQRRARTVDEHRRSVH
ncbi:MAG: DinB family protein [Dehalococcoidia bacterium]|nr:DinB family protein [Dehalococcoidia bacterium]